MKKILSLILTLAMLLSFCNLSVFAEGETTNVAEINGIGYPTVEEAIENAEAGGTIKLLADVESIFVIDKAITIDGDNHKVTAKSGESQFTKIEGTVTIKNIIFDNGTEAIRTDYGNYGAATDDYEQLDLVIDSCTFNNVTNYAIMGGSDTKKLKSLTVKNCTFNADSESNLDNYFVWAQQTETLIVEGCTFNGNGVTKGAIHTGDGACATTATITGGTISGVARGIQTGNDADSSVTVSGVTFTEIATNTNSSSKTGAIYIHENSVAGNTVSVESCSFDANTTVIYNDNNSADDIAEILNFGTENKQENVVITEVKTAGTEVDVAVGDASTYVAFINETGYESIEDAIAEAQTGDTIKLAAGTFTTPINLGGKDINLTGTVANDGTLLTVFDNSSANPMITMHNTDGTVSNIKIANAWKAVYAEPAGNVTFDNVDIYGCTYGLHLVAYSNDVTWNIQNCEIDVTWANSLGKSSDVDGATINITNNKFLATDPYYDGYVVLSVNTFSNKTTISNNYFGTDSAIRLSTEAAASGSTIGTNYYADGYQNALSSDSDGTVAEKIDTYYSDPEMTTVVIAPKGTLNNAAYMTTNYNGSGAHGFRGEANIKGTESFEVKLFEGETQVGSAKLVDNDKVLLCGKSKSVSWHILVDAKNDTDSWWDTKWTNGTLTVDTLPDTVELWIDGVKVDSCAVTLSEADCYMPIYAVETDDEGNVIKFLGAEGYTNSTQQAPKYSEAFEAALNNAGEGDVTISLLRDIELSYDAREAYGSDNTTSITIDGNGHTLTLNQTNSDWSSLGLANAEATLKLNDIVINKGTNPGNGAWNNHAIKFTAPVEMTDVTINNAISVQAGAKLNNVTINEDEDYYALWIEAKKQTVEIDGLTINSAGRGIKIDEQYVNTDDDNIYHGEEVTLSIADATFTTEKKAAILVKNSASTTITASGKIDITGVVADSKNLVWVDEDSADYADMVTVNGAAVKVEGAPENYVAQIGDTKYSSLQAALDAAVSGTGNVTVEILSDIDLSNVDWNPVTVSAPGYPMVTVNGNEHTITGLNDMLFAGTWAGNSGLVINDLTIKDSKIEHDVDDTKGTIGVGAFIGYPQASATITLNNCHLIDSTVSGGHWTGGLIGMAGGYNGNDGPVFMNLTITGCSVTGSTITGKGSVGGIIGHGSCAAWTNVIIKNTTVSGNTVTSTGSSANKAGAVMGTIGAAGQETTAAGETKTGGAFVSATVSDNTVTSNGTAITTIYGRQGTETGVLAITGGTYDKYPIEENVTYAAPMEGYSIIENADGTYGVAPEVALSGSGTEEDPFVITNLEDLILFRDSVNAGKTKYNAKNVYIKVDDETTSISLEDAWTPIGNGTTPFVGNFDGNNVTIYNLSVTGTDYVGFFGKSDGATIKNITLTNPTVTGVSYVGAIVGQGYTGTIDNCKINGNKYAITGNYMVGGISGQGYAKITNCSVTKATITATYKEANLEGDNVGGIVGHLGEGASMSNCTVSGSTITGTRKIGGIVGNGFGNNKLSDLSVTNTTIGTTATADYATSNTSSMGLGGIIGCISNSYTGGYVNDSYVYKVTFTNTNSVSANYGVILGVQRVGGDLQMTGSGNTANIASITPVAGTEVNKLLLTVVAKIGETEYYTLQDAVTAGGDITLLVDTNETITVADDATVSINLGGKTLTGYIAPCNPTSLTVTNGSILNVDDSVSAIEVNAGTFTLNDVNIDSARHAVRIDGSVTATIDGGTYKGGVGSSKITAHAVNVSGAANVTINDGQFYGPKANIDSDSGAAVNVQSGATVTINGGTFKDGKNNTLAAAGSLTVYGGTFDQNPKAYLAEGYAACYNADISAYVAGEMPEAEVTDDSPWELKAGDYNVYTGSLASGTADMTLPIALVFTAKDTTEEAKANAFGYWNTDFYISMTGVEGKIDLTGCYLVGNYGTFGTIAIPLDGVEIVGGKTYPVLGSMMTDWFDYWEICADVKEFKCGIYLTEEVLKANPDLNVNLSLRLAPHTIPETSTDVNFLQVGETYSYDVNDLSKEDLFKIAGSNMTLGNDLSMNFYIAKADIDGNDYYVNITKTYEDKDDVVITIPYTEWIDNDANYWKVSFDGIAAKEMCDDIYIQVFNGDGTAASEKATDGVRIYAMKRLANSSTSNKEKTTLVDMLNYGAAAQTEFDYNTTDLANSLLTDEQKALATDEVSCEIITETSNDKAAGATLVLVNNIVLRLWFKDIDASMYAMVTYEDHYGVAHEYKIEGSAFIESNGYYAVPIDTLVVADGYQPITCTIYNSDSTEVVKVTESVSSYIARAMQNGSTQYESIIRFISSAKDYLSNK